MTGQQLSLEDWTPPATHRYGTTYSAPLDFDRLNAQQQRVWGIVKDGQPHTLHEIAERTGDPEASISARLRDLRNMFGVKVEKKRNAEGRGTWLYAVSK